MRNLKRAMLAIVVLAAAGAMAFATDWYAIVATGGTMSGGGFTLTGGQAILEAGPAMSGGGFELGDGFYSAPPPQENTAVVDWGAY